MKYYLPELLYPSECISKAEEEIVQRTLRENMQKYHEEYVLIRERLPKRFIHNLEKGKLHDAQIKEISLKEEQQGKKKLITVKILLEHDCFNLLGNLIFYDVVDFKMDQKNDKNRSGIGSYLYGEIFVKENIWEYNMLTMGDELGELNIYCHKIKWEPVKR